MESLEKNLALAGLVLANFGVKIATPYMDLMVFTAVNFFMR